MSILAGAADLNLTPTADARVLYRYIENVLRRFNIAAEQSTPA